MYDSKGKAELDPKTFNEKIELNRANLSVHERRPELERVQSNAIFQFEVTSTKGVKHTYVLKAPKRTLRDDWVKEIERRMVAQHQLFTEQKRNTQLRTVRLPSPAKYSAGQLIQADEDPSIEGWFVVEIVFDNGSDGPGSIVLSPDSPSQKDEEIEKFVKSRKESLKKQANEDPEDKVDLTSSSRSIQLIPSTSVQDVGATELEAGSQENQPQILPEKPALQKVLALCCKCLDLDKKDVKQFDVSESTQLEGGVLKALSWSQVAALAFNPRAQAPAKQTQKHKNFVSLQAEIEHKVFVLRLALFSVLLVSSFVACRFLLSDSLIKSMVCIILTSVSMLISVSFSTRNTMLKREFAQRVKFQAFLRKQTATEETAAKKRRKPTRANFS